MRDYHQRINATNLGGLGGWGARSRRGWAERVAGRRRRGRRRRRVRLRTLVFRLGSTRRRWLGTSRRWLGTRRGQLALVVVLGLGGIIRRWWWGIVTAGLAIALMLNIRSARWRWRRWASTRQVRRGRHATARWGRAAAWRRRGGECPTRREVGRKRDRKRRVNRDKSGSGIRLLVVNLTKSSTLLSRN